MSVDILIFLVMMLGMMSCSEVFPIKLCSCYVIWAVVHFDETKCLAFINKACVSRRVLTAEVTLFFRRPMLLCCHQRA